MDTVGLIALSAKPFHLGHSGLIQLAAAECDEVHVYVSTSDRARKGEFTVKGSVMEAIWTGMIERTLPDNVKVEYGGSPVGKVWAELGKASEACYTADSPSATYVVYGDPHDLAANFPLRSIVKYAGELDSMSQLRLRPVRRGVETADVSGTQMRLHLANGDRLAFIRGLPVGLDGAAVWDALRGTGQR